MPGGESHLVCVDASFQRALSFSVRIAVLSHHSGATRQLAPEVGLEPTGDCSQRFSRPRRYQLRFTLAYCIGFPVLSVQDAYCNYPGLASHLTDESAAWLHHLSYSLPAGRPHTPPYATGFGTWRCVEVSIPLCVSAGFGLANRPLTFRATHRITRIVGSHGPLVACSPPSHYGLFGVALRRVTIAIGLFSVRLSEGSDPALLVCHHHGCAGY